eukprot:2683820-Pleurochrysis_carterae.AAC.1
MLVASCPQPIEPRVALVDCILLSALCCFDGGISRGQLIALQAFDFGVTTLQILLQMRNAFCSIVLCCVCCALCEFQLARCPP